MAAPHGLRELDARAREDLEGIWIAGGLGDRCLHPPTPLTWQLVLDDHALLGNRIAERGSSLPRLSRRLVRVSGYAYQALVPFVRVARDVLRLDA
ncbi:MAG TPA: hypothetical protein VKY73_06810, partial [Polyangiaceae bacterium]|nr:hypothetical protein [Polyangiaceae bacterium]